MTHLLRKIIRYIIDSIFPSPNHVKRLEDTTTASLYARTTPAPYISKDISAVFQYRDPHIQRLIWELKYQGNTRIAKMLAEALADTIITQVFDGPVTMSDNWIITPIPLTPDRQRERGWNQGTLLLKHLCVYLPDTITCYSDILTRSNTSPQTSLLNKQERKQNVKGSFSVPYNSQPIVNGASIILIDDVTTTGATFTDARRALKEAGAIDVQAFAIAH